MLKKGDQIVDIKIHLHNIKSAVPYNDLKALQTPDIGRKSSLLSQQPKTSKISIINYLNSFANHEKQKPQVETKEFNDSSLNAFKSLKNRSTPTENNEAFKFLKNRLANKHYETISRPNFNAAGIIPVAPTEKIAKDIYDRKITKR